MLPQIVVPEFSTVIPSTQKQIRFRPFLVKEEKILLIAFEGNDETEIMNAVLKVLDNCIIDDVNVDELCTFDMEFLFLKIRGKSVGEDIELSVGHSSNDNVCKKKTSIVMKIDEVNINDEVQDGKIMITDSIGIKLKYPTVGMIRSINGKDSESNILFKLMTDCTEYLYDKKTVHNDFTPKELTDWIDNLNQHQFKKINDFFSTIPVLKHKLEWTCSECKEKDSITLEGLQSFFT